MMTVFGSCVSKPPNPEPKNFKSIEEATEAAITSLQELFMQDIKIDIGINKEQAQKLVPGKEINYVMLDYQKLLKADSSLKMKELESGKISSIIPLFVDKTVVTSVELSQTEEGWQIASIGGKQFANELEALSKTGKMEVKVSTIYKVPNLPVHVYEQKFKDKTSAFYLKHKDVRMSEKLTDEKVISILNKKAKIFEKEFGDQLKKEKLVD